jgi:hypothetical protein
VDVNIAAVGNFFYRMIGKLGHRYIFTANRRRTTLCISITLLVLFVMGGAAGSCLSLCTRHSPELCCKLAPLGVERFLQVSESSKAKRK